MSLRTLEAGVEWLQSGYTTSRRSGKAGVHLREAKWDLYSGGQLSVQWGLSMACFSVSWSTPETGCLRRQDLRQSSNGRDVSVGAELGPGLLNLIFLLGLCGEEYGRLLPSPLLLQGETNAE